MRLPLFASVLYSFCKAAGAQFVHVELHVTDESNGGSTGPLEIAFPASSDAVPIWQPVPLAAGGLKKGTWFKYDFPIAIGSSDSPPVIALRSVTDDGLGIDQIKVGAGRVVEALPRWLDLDCLAVAQQVIPCGEDFRWTIEYPPTTTSTSTRTSTTRTRTTTTTRTRTTTTVTTATTTTTTTSLTTTTTTTSIPPLMPAKSISEVASFNAAPPAFYNELEASLTIRANWSAASPNQTLDDYAASIGDVVKEFVGLKVPPNVVDCKLHQVGPDAARALLRFRLIGDTDGTTAVHIQETLRDDALRHRLNEMLTRIGQSSSGSSVGVGDVEVSFIHCRVGALFCCVSVVVYSIVHNAGVMRAYKYMFIISMILAVLVIGLLCSAGLCASLTRRALKANRSPERVRGFVIMPLLLVGAIFQSVVCTVGSFLKFHIISAACAKPKDWPEEFVSSCPPNRVVMMSEIMIFGILNVGLVVLFACFWHREWKPDCVHDFASLESVEWRPVMPLESVIRRSHLLGFLEVRNTDIAGKIDHGLLIINDLAISFAVALTSFFALQQYSLPGVLVAWQPYKVLYELIIGFLMREAFRKTAMLSCVRSRRRKFVSSGICVFVLVDVWLWTLILRTYLRMQDAWSFEHSMRLLDIAVGAGLLNYLLTQLNVALWLRVLSAYVYEPFFRHHVKRCVYVSSGEEIELLEQSVAASKKCWIIEGRPQPLGVPGAFLSEITPKGSVHVTPSYSLDRRKRPRMWTGSSMTRSMWNRSTGQMSDDIETASDFGANSEESETSSDDDGADGYGWENSFDISKRPLVIQLRRTDRNLSSCLVGVLDTIASVQKDLPVIPRRDRVLYGELSASDRLFHSLAFLREAPEETATDSSDEENRDATAQPNVDADADVDLSHEAEFVETKSLTPRPRPQGDRWFDFFGILDMCSGR